jgi:hypothetical protein
MRAGSRVEGSHLLLSQRPEMVLEIAACHACSILWSAEPECRGVIDNISRQSSRKHKLPRAGSKRGSWKRRAGLRGKRGGAARQPCLVKDDDCANRRRVCSHVTTSARTNFPKPRASCR